MQSTNNVGFLTARIRNVRLISETAEIGRVSGQGNATLTMLDETRLEARWENTPQNEQVLVVSPSLNIKFTDETGVSVISYRSKHEVRFLINAYTGFDPQQTLPEEALVPYSEMALWVVKGRATVAIRSMGLTTFSWPNLEDVSELTSDTPPDTRKPRSPRAKKPKA